MSDQRSASSGLANEHLEFAAHTHLQQDLLIEHPTGSCHVSCQSPDLSSQGCAITAGGRCDVVRGWPRVNSCLGELQVVVRWRAVVRRKAEQLPELPELGARHVVDVAAADVHRDGVAELILARRVAPAVLSASRIHQPALQYSGRE